MKNLNEIKIAIKEDLVYFDSLLEKQIYTEDELLKDKIQYLFEPKGKRIRPILVYLIARMFNHPNANTHLTAFIVEILHTATLIHDDVVDNSSLRRGRVTSNNKWDNKTAILLGDYLFAKCMYMIYEKSFYGLFDIISPVLVDLSYGELQQLKYNNKNTCDKDEYFEIINKKTASLIAACCVAGAYSVGAKDSDLKQLHKFGIFIGQIYQIRDDILDYSNNKNTGKDFGNDITERKMTLPLILALEKSPENEKKNIISLWESNETKNGDIKNIKKFVKKYNGIKDSIEIMNKLKTEALKILKPYENSDYKEALEVFLKQLTQKEQVLS